MTTPLLHFTLLLSVAGLSGYLFGLLHVPVAWLLGPMVTGIGAVWLGGRPRPLQPAYQMVGQAVIGLSTGIGFPLATLMAAAGHALPLAAAVVITGGLSLLNGWLLWRWAGVDRATGFMGSLPGAASSMVAMSDEMGADPVAVAVLQYLRLLLVVFLAPVAVHTLFPAGNWAADSVTAGAVLPAAAVWPSLAVLALAGSAGATAGKLVRLPSPTFLGPFLLALPLAWLSPVQWQMPAPVFQGALLLVGLSIGLRFDIPRARQLGRAALVETGLVIALIGACLAVGYGFHRLTGVDPLTAVLGSTPGGMEVMVASAVELGGDAGLVLAMQMFRWLIVLAVGPWVAVRLVRKANG